MLQLLSVLGLVLTASQGMTTTEAPRAEEGTAMEAREGATSAGYRVILDPATGRIVNEPTGEQIEAFAEDLGIRERRPSARNLRRFVLVRGGEGVFLDGWADQALAVERTADGSLRPVCNGKHEHKLAANVTEPER